jgi:hypothetical protein
MYLSINFWYSSLGMEDSDESDSYYIYSYYKMFGLLKDLPFKDVITESISSS